MLCRGALVSSLLAAALNCVANSPSTPVRESSEPAATPEASDAPTPAAPSVEVITLDYGPGNSQVLDLYVPAATPTTPMPTLVLAHGGLWQFGDRGALAGLCAAIVLGSAGTQACASVEYRLSEELGGRCAGGPDSYREQLHDFAAAFALLQAQAERHGIDPARMYIGGHSAGGHLAQMLNLRWPTFASRCARADGCPPPVAAIGIEGIYDIPGWDAYDQAHFAGQYRCATRFAFGDPPAGRSGCVDPSLGRACWEAGSPLALAEHARELDIHASGKVLLIHSPADTLTDITQVAAFAQALRGSAPDIDVIASTEGACASGGHSGVLEEPALAGCLIAYLRSDGMQVRAP